MYMGTAGFIVTIILGICVSYITRNTDQSNLPNGVIFNCSDCGPRTKSYDMAEKTEKHNESFVDEISAM